MKRRTLFAVALSGILLRASEVLGIEETKTSVPEPKDPVVDYSSLISEGDKFTFCGVTYVLVHSVSGPGEIAIGSAAEDITKLIRDFNPGTRCYMTLDSKGFVLRMAPKQ